MIAGVDTETRDMFSWARMFELCKIDELESRVSGQVLWLRNLNKSREVSVVKETTTTFILMLEITNNYGLAWPTSLIPPGIITVGEAFHH